MSGDVLAVKPQNPALAWGTAIGVASLALGGFTLSFSALRDLAIRSGITTELAFIWPLIVDGFIVVATAAAFGLKRRGPRVTWYPWSALAVFALVSVAGNASHAMSSPDVSVPVWIATIVSSVPALALLIASHLLIVMIDGKPARNRVARAGKHQTESRRPESPAAERVSAEATTENVDIKRPALRAVEPPIDDGRGVKIPLMARLENVVADGGQITGALIADLEGVSERTGRRRAERIRDERPDLFGAAPVLGQITAAEVSS